MASVLDFLSKPWFLQCRNTIHFCQGHAAMKDTKFQFGGVDQVRSWIFSLSLVKCMCMLYFPMKSCLKINCILLLSHFRAFRTKMEGSVWLINLKLNFRRKIFIETRYLFMCEHCALSNYHMYFCISVSNFLTLTKLILNQKLKVQTSV